MPWVTIVVFHNILFLKGVSFNLTTWPSSFLINYQHQPFSVKILHSTLSNTKKLLHGPVVLTQLVSAFRHSHLYWFCIDKHKKKKLLIKVHNQEILCLTRAVHISSSWSINNITTFIHLVYYIFNISNTLSKNHQLRPLHARCLILNPVMTPRLWMRQCHMTESLV